MVILATAPLEGDDISEGAAGENDLFYPDNVDQRIDYVASGLLMHMPRNDREQEAKSTLMEEAGSTA